MGFKEFLYTFARQSSSVIRRNITRSSSNNSNPIFDMNHIPLNSRITSKIFNSGSAPPNKGYDDESLCSKKFNISSMIGILLIILTASTMLFRDYIGTDTPQCRSIYMYPSYARIDGFDKRFTPLAQKYHLYLYREQGKDQEPMNQERIQLNGIPVLFIPGNAGSFRQVRSIAAACADLYFDSRDSIDNEKTQNIDFFTADFNEDFTAFHGQTMLDQAEYLNDAVAYILSLYEQSVAETSHPIPKSVIIVAHSMGGIVARVMPTLQNHVPGSMNSLITLSSPHAAAPITFDGDILKIYKRTNDYWRQQFDDEESFFSKNVSLVSITGSIQDTVLPADYAALQDLVPVKNGFTTFTTTIPGVWTPIDHLAIVWCKQLRVVLSKLLLEMIDNTTPYKTRSLYERISISKILLLSGFEDNYRDNLIVSHVEQQNIFQSIIDSNNFETLPIGKPLIFSKHSTYESNNNLGIIEIPKNVDDNFDFTIITSGKRPSFFFCSRGSDLNCTAKENDMLLIPRSMPSVNYPADSSMEEKHSPFLYFQASKEELIKYDIILVKKPETDLFQDDDFLYASLKSSSSVKIMDYSPLRIYLFGARTELESDDATTNIDLSFVNQWDSLLSYTVKVDATKESLDNLLFQPMIRQWIQNPAETKWHVNILQNKVFDINMHSVAPYIPLDENNPHGLHLNVILPPNTSLTLKIDVNWLLTFKMLFIRYRLAIGSIPIFFIALVISMQFYQYGKTDNYPSFVSTIAILINEYSNWIGLGFLALNPITNFKGIQHILYFLDPVKLNRPFILESKNIFTNFYFLGIRNWSSSWIGLCFGFMSLGLLSIILHLINFVKTVTVVACNKLSRTTTECDDDLLKHKILFDRKRIVACVLLILAVIFYIPYQLAYLIMLLIQAGTCIRIVIHMNRFKTIRVREYSNLLNYNISILILFLIVAIINAPIIVVFLHNVGIKYETTFRSHHNFVSVAPIILLVAINSTFNIPTYPKMSFDWYVAMGLLVYLSFFSLIYGTRNLYFIHDIMNIICGWLFFGSVTDYMVSKSAK